jgi:RimJ/RimL family protein N-acetyltransferase
MLRPFQMQDASPLFEALDESRPELTTSLPQLARIASKVQCLEWIDARGHDALCDSALWLAVTTSDHNQLAGSCWMSHMKREPGTARLGYWLRPSQQGRGLATKAARMLARYAFAQLGLHRLDLLVPDSHVPSIQVARRLGATCEGVHLGSTTRLGRKGVSLRFSLRAASWDLN